MAATSNRAVRRNVTLLETPKDAQRHVSLRDQAYHAIKRLIITTGLRPGEILSEPALSTQLDIGRTPIRQAIDRLLNDGLVEVMPRKGTIVKPVSLDEILNIIDARIVNETFCVRVAAERASTEVPAQLRRNLEAMREAAQARDIETIADLDQAFHAIIAGSARNPVMSDLLRNLHERSARMWFISLSTNEQHSRICDEHAAIVDGIARQDPDAAERAMRAHIESFRANITRQG
jgi:DNA-binding GntR family transcriptional regulator